MCFSESVLCPLKQMHLTWTSAWKLQTTIAAHPRPIAADQGVVHWSSLLMWPIMWRKMVAESTSAIAAWWRHMKGTMCHSRLCLSAILQSEDGTGPYPSPAASTTATALCLWRGTPLKAPGMRAKLLTSSCNLFINLALPLLQFLKTILPRL